MTYKRIQFLFAFIAMVLLGAMSACAPSNSGKESERSRLIKDDLEREVRVAATVERAISLAPSITEMVFAAGAGDKLVGVTSYCNFPDGADAIEKIGDTQTPNIESIVRIMPQIVLVSTASQLEAFSNILEQQGIAVYVVDVRGIDDVPNRLRMLGKVFGTESAASETAASFERRIEKIEAGIAGRERPQVFVQISNEPLFTIGKGSFITELVSRAGGVSVTQTVKTAYPKISKETAAAYAPDVIILSDSEDNREPNAIFIRSPAVRDARVHRIDADIISRPGPRLVDALELIAAAINDTAKK